MRPPFRLFLALLAGVLALSACGSARPPAAVVDGQTITDAQLQDQIGMYTFLSNLQQQPCGQAQRGETPDSACARFTLSNLIVDDLVLHYADAHDLRVSGDSVTGAISQLESSLGGAAKLDEKLKANGVTRSQVLALARRRLLFNRAEQAIGTANVTDAQLHQAYEQQQQQFVEIHAKHILVKSRALAQRIAAEATPGNFARLAKRYSIDTQSAANGGDLGTLPASQLDQGFVQGALALSPGQISGPVQSQFGWHVIMLVSTDVQSFEQVKDQLAGSLSSQAFSSWLQDRLADADIRVNPRYGRLDEQTGQIVPVRTTQSVASPAAGSGASASPASP
jgi:hypothetical protein